MAEITYIKPNGVQQSVNVPTGNSVMQGAVRNAVDGIVAECGGGMACATCRCYVDDAWIERVGAPSETEKEMLDFADDGGRRGARLSCQITVSDALDGLVVRLPESQF